MTWAAPLQHRGTGRLDHSRVLWFALLGGLVVVLASGLAYLGTIVWEANWPVFDSDSVERVVQHSLLVFILAWIPINYLTGMVFQSSNGTLQAAMALSLWTAWSSVGPVRTMSLALFAIAALLITILTLPFLRAGRGARGQSRAVPEGAVR